MTHVHCCLVLGAGWLPFEVTMTHVWVFYAFYFGVFALFIGGIAFLKILARRAMLRQQTDAALRLYDRLWFLFGPAVRRELKPQIQINLAIVHASQGNTPRAIQLLSDARRGSRDLKSPDLLIQSCVLYARLQQQRQMWDQAAFALQEARKASEKDRRAPALVRIVMAQIELATQRGQADEVLALWQHVRRLADARRDEATAVLAITQLGRAAYEAGDWPCADDFLSEAVSRVREFQLTDRSAILACLLFGRLQLQRGHYELARGYLLDATQKAKHRAEPALQCSALIETGRLQVEQGRFDKALEAGEEALAIAATLNDPARQAMACQVMGDLYLQSDKPQVAQVYYERTLVAAKHANLPRTSLLAKTGLALVEAQIGDTAEALSALHDLSREAQTLNASFEQIAIQDALALVALAMGDGMEAQRYQSMAHSLRQDLGVVAALSAQYRIPHRFSVEIGGSAG